MTLTPAPSGASELFQLLRDGVPRTRAELAALAGLARSTVGLRVDELVGVGLVQAVGDAVSSGGRPAYRFAIDPGARLLLAVDCGAFHQNIALCDLDSTVLALATHHSPINEGPEKILRLVADTARDLLRELGRDEHDLLALGIGLPGPVEHSSGRPLQPPIMPGWDGFDVVGWVERELGIPALVDNDVNVMAVGERTLALPDVDDLLFVKVATGIGAGIISGGALQRGARGTAGDIGHVRVARAAGIRCSCGKDGCLEAIASGGALARALGLHTAGEVAERASSGDATAIEAVRRAGRDLGEVLLSCVSLINPATIVIGSALAIPELLDGVRDVLFDPELPEASRQIDLHTAAAGDLVGVVGACVVAREHALSTDGVDALLAR